MPALMLLAQDVGLTRLAFGMQGVERQIQTLFRRFPSIDSTPAKLHRDFFPLVPKKAGPDQWVPVTRQAIGDRLLKISPHTRILLR